MPLAPGTTLGPYSVTAQIGAGGMGEWRSRCSPRRSRLTRIRVARSEAPARRGVRARSVRRWRKLTASIREQRMGSRVGVAPSLVLVAICAVAGVWALANDALAQTQRRVFGPQLVESGARISYRALTRDDFRAAKRPDDVADTHGRLGALTCVDLTTHPDLFIRATSEGNDAQLGRVRARVHNLAFTASMDRDCSWWNPQHVGLPHEYILEHEQIHFALFEIAARRLNQHAARIQERVEAAARTQDEAIRRGAAASGCRAARGVRTGEAAQRRPRSSNIVRPSPRAPAVVVSPGRRGAQPPACRRAAAVRVVVYAKWGSWLACGRSGSSGAQGSAQASTADPDRLPLTASGPTAARHAHPREASGTLR